MNLNEYQKLALRTAPEATQQHDLLHAGLGFASEAGEFLDVLKKQHAYGKPLDLANLQEEVGDILWYAVIACRALGITLEDAANTNIAKLESRYKAGFTQEEALNRDTQTERVVIVQTHEKSLQEAGILALAKEYGTIASELSEPVLHRYVLGAGFVLEKQADRWCVTSSNRIVAQTEPNSRLLTAMDDATDGPWFFAAQATLNQILDSR